MRRNHNRHSLVLLIFAALSLPRAGFAQGSFYDDNKAEPLELSVTKGVPPLSVRIVGPKLFVDKVQNWNGVFYFGSSGFSINWGDGSHEPVMVDNPSPKKDYLQHSFTVPGVYHIYASKYHLGPTDAPVTEWRNGASVQVIGSEPTGTATQPAIKVDFLSPKGREACSYQNFPDVEWRLDTDRRVDVHIELLCGEKVLTHQVVEGVANRGFYHNDTLQFQSWNDLDAILRKQGTAKLKVRIRLVNQQGQPVLTRDSNEFTMSSELKLGDGGLKLVDRDPSKPTTVTITYDVWHPKRFSYKLDWGDGKIDQHTAPSSAQALLQKTEHKFVHTYSARGKYRIKLRSNNHDPFEKVDDIVSYEALDVDLNK